MGGDYMENRGLKNRVPFSSTLKTELDTKFNDLSVITLIPKSKLLDKAITLLLESYDIKV